MTKLQGFTEQSSSYPSVMSLLILGVKNNWVGILIFTTLLVAWGIAELAEIVNLVSISTPLTVDELVGLSVGILSLVLTFAIVLLYQRQTLIQKHQRKLMEMEYRPIIRADIEILDGNRSIPVLTITNTGREAALSVETDWGFLSQDRRWSSSFLSSGRVYRFPLLISETGDSLSVTDIKDLVDPSTKEQNYPDRLKEFKGIEVDGQLTWRVECEDIIGHKYVFSEQIDVLDSFERLEHVSSVSEMESLQKITERLEGIEDQLEQMNNPLLSPR